MDNEEKFKQAIDKAVDRAFEKFDIDWAKIKEELISKIAEGIEKKEQEVRQSERAKVFCGAEDVIYDILSDESYPKLRGEKLERDANHRVAQLIKQRLSEEAQIDKTYEEKLKQEERAKIVEMLEEMPTIIIYYCEDCDVELTSIAMHNADHSFIRRDWKNELIQKIKEMP